MPAFLEAKLKKEAAKKGFTDAKADRYVYGAMNNMGAMGGSKETAKGRRMEKKHAAKTSGDKASTDKMRSLSELA
jgi:hypothetical protein